MNAARVVLAHSLADVPHRQDITFNLQTIDASPSA